MCKKTVKFLLDGVFCLQYMIILDSMFLDGLQVRALLDIL